MSAPAIRTKTGIHSIYSQSIIKLVTYCQRIHSVDPDRVPKICLLDKYGSAQFLGKLTYQSYFTAWIFLPSTLSTTPQTRKFLNRDSLISVPKLTWDYWQKKSRSLNWLLRRKLFFSSEKYLSMCLTQFLRRSYSRSRFELLESMAKHGCFRYLPLPTIS